MHVSSSKNNHLRLGAIKFLMLGMFLVPVFSAMAQATTTQDTLDAAKEILAAQQRVTEARQALEAATALATVDQSTKPENIFSLSNPSLWILVAILLGVLLLLLAIRRSILESSTYLVTSPVRTVHPSQTQKVSDAGAPDKALVYPVKVVKIKVRKLTKTHRA